MAEGKWIDDLQGAMSVAAAARQVLGVRLKAVEHCLASALHGEEADVEPVHDLRVSTRRAGAALRIFKDLLPGKIARRIRKALRRVRGAAGDARDWDVFLETIPQLAPAPEPGERPGLDLLIGIAHGKRMDAQIQLHQVAGWAHGNGSDAHRDSAGDTKLGRLFEKGISRLRRAKGLRKGMTLKDLAVGELGELLGEFERAASGELSDYQQLHQVRILGKHVRYAMEIFESCFGNAFREEYYPAVEEMQEMLGLANDSAVASRHLEGVEAWVGKSQAATWERYAPGLERLLQFHRERLLGQRQQFEDWLSRWSKTRKEFGRILGEVSQESS